jgi:hypothetical protein
MNKRDPKFDVPQRPPGKFEACFYTTALKERKEPQGLEYTEEWVEMKNGTYECITRADFLIFFAGGSFANRGVLALDEAVAPGGGGARSGGGDEEAGVPSASSSSSCSFLDRFRLVPLRKKCSDGASGPIGDDGNAAAGCT